MVFTRVNMKLRPPPMYLHIASDNLLDMVCMYHNPSLLADVGCIFCVLFNITPGYLPDSSSLDFVETSNWAGGKEASHQRWQNQLITHWHHLQITAIPSDGLVM